MKSQLDFNIIDTHDFKTLAILDTSVYNHNIVISQEKIEITLPGHTDSASPTFMVKSLNVFNSYHLGLTNVDCNESLINLPDGIYKVKYSICPNDQLYIEKFFIRTSIIQCRLSQAFLSLDLTCDENDRDIKRREDLEEIDTFYIQGAIAACNNQDVKLAGDLLRKGNLLLSSLMDFNKCNC